MEKPELRYDGSFEGFLCCIYYVYHQKVEPYKIISKNIQSGLFNPIIEISTEEEIADRVLMGILSKSSKKVIKFIFQCFLSELKEIELKLLYFIKMVLAGKDFKIKDYSDPMIVDLHNIKKKVSREVHRIHAFVRFQETKEGIWVCEINPDFNVLPLIGKHFKDRYPSFNWVIIDTKRQTGLMYEKQYLAYISYKKRRQGVNRLKEEHKTIEEKSYQALWKQYFKSVNIEERNNSNLHLQHVPKRYWKYLIEKQ
jgi:probable DNA metabolism protein